MDLIDNIKGGLAACVERTKEARGVAEDAYGYAETLWYDLTTGMGAASAQSLRLTNGKIIKVGAIAAASVGYYGDSLFPTAFPNACDAVLVCIGNQPSNLLVMQLVAVAAKRRTGFDWCVRSFSPASGWVDGATDLRFYYIAVGY